MDLLNKDYSEQLRKSRTNLADEDGGDNKAQTEEINNDLDPIVIRRKNEENIEYKQNVFIRWLQPPTPPPPAPIISMYSIIE